MRITILLAAMVAILTTACKKNIFSDAPVKTEAKDTATDFQPGNVYHQFHFTYYPSPESDQHVLTGESEILLDGVIKGVNTCAGDPCQAESLEKPAEEFIQAAVPQVLEALAGSKHSESLQALQDANILRAGDDAGNERRLRKALRYYVNAELAPAWVAVGNTVRDTTTAYHLRQLAKDFALRTLKELFFGSAPLRPVTMQDDSDGVALRTTSRLVGALNQRIPANRQVLIGVDTSNLVDRPYTHYNVYLVDEMSSSACHGAQIVSFF